MLFDDAMRMLRDLFIASPLAELGDDELNVDLFCGGGGFDEGAREAGIAVHAAVNHSPIAIECHSQNHPDCEHFEGDAWKLPPEKVIRRRRCGVLLASAACTTHSRARGSAPISPRVHMLGYCIAKYLKIGQFRGFVVENVPEWQLWGPTIIKRHRNGKPVRDEDGKIVRIADPERLGQQWRRWLKYVRRLGYEVEFKVIDGPDYGEASRRKRLFVIGRRDGGLLDWPERSHGASGLPPHRPAVEVIDWSDLGQSIFLNHEEGVAAGVKRPLADKSLERIACGVVEEVLNDPKPFVLRLSQPDGSHVYGVDGPIPTQTARQDLAVCTPLVAQVTQQGFNGRGIRRADGPLGTLTTCQDWAAVSPVIVRQNHGNPAIRPDDTLGTITTQSNRHALVAPLLAKFYGGVFGHDIRTPMGTVTGIDHHALVSPLLATVGHGERPGQSLRVRRGDSPLNTVTTNGPGEALVSPVMAYFNHGGKQTGRVDAPLRTIVAGGMHAALIAPFLVQYYGNSSRAHRADQSLGAVTTLDRHGLVTVVIDGTTWVMIDILFRMLRPHELALAMGFPSHYLWPRSQRKATFLIGNAVQVKVAKAIVSTMFPRGQKQKRRRAAA